MRFVGAVMVTAKKHIPRRYRRHYIPEWNETNEELYKECILIGDKEMADELIHSLDVARREKCTGFYKI